MQISIDNSLPEYRNPSRSAETYIRIEPATECDGEPCGLTSYDGEVVPVIQPSHFHVVVNGKLPNAGPRYYAVWAAELA